MQARSGTSLAVFTSFPMPCRRRLNHAGGPFRGPSTSQESVALVMPIGRPRALPPWDAERGSVEARPFNGRLPCRAVSADGDHGAPCSRSDLAESPAPVQPAERRVTLRRPARGRRRSWGSASVSRCDPCVSDLDHQPGRPKVRGREHDLPTGRITSHGVADQVPKIFCALGGADPHRRIGDWHAAEAQLSGCVVVDVAAAARLGRFAKSFVRVDCFAMPLKLPRARGA